MRDQNLSLQMASRVLKHAPRSSEQLGSYPSLEVWRIWHHLRRVPRKVSDGPEPPIPPALAAWMHDFGESWPFGGYWLWTPKNDFLIVKPPALRLHACDLQRMLSSTPPSSTQGTTMYMPARSTKQPLLQWLKPWPVPTRCASLLNDLAAVRSVHR